MEEIIVEETIVQIEKPAVVAEPIVEAIDRDAVVVTVNEIKIVEGEVSDELTKRVDAQEKRMRPGREIEEPQRQQMRKRIVDMKVDQILIDQEMEKNNITVTDEQVIEEIKKIAGQNSQSLEEVEKQIAQMGMTMDDLKGQIRTQMQIKVLMESQDPNTVVTEADAQKFYDENPQHFGKPAQVKASHILCGKRGITEAEFPAELEKIEAAQARLDAGEKFEDVAKDVSTCPSSANGGDLGFFGKGQMDPAFEKAAFETEPGQTTGIVKTSFGYHIIKVTAKNEAKVTPFEEVKDQITGYLTQQKQRVFMAEFNKTVRENATIEYSAKEQALRDEMEKAAAAQQAARAAKPPMPVQSAPAPKPAEEN